MSREKRTLTLSDESTIDVVAPGPAAYMARSGMLPLAATILRENHKDGAAQLRAIAASIDPESIEAAITRFVCACTRSPRLTTRCPAPPGMVYFDDLDRDDWQQVAAAVDDMTNEAEEYVRDFSEPKEAKTPCS